MANFSTDAAYGAYTRVAPASVARLNAAINRRGESALATGKTLTDMDFLRAKALEAMAQTGKLDAETAALQPPTDADLARVAALGAGTTQPVATAFLGSQAGEPLPSQDPAMNTPVPADVGTKLGKTLYALLASRMLPGKTNFQEMTAGQGNLQQQDLTAEAAAPTTARPRLVQLLEVLSKKPEMYHLGSQGEVLDAATGNVDESSGLAQSKIKALEALASERKASGDRSLKGPNLGRVAQVEHLMQNYDMSIEDAIDTVRRLNMTDKLDSAVQLRLKLRELANKGTFSRKRADEMYQQLLHEFDLTDEAPAAAPGTPAAAPPAPPAPPAPAAPTAPAAAPSAPVRPQEKPAELNDQEWKRLQELRQKYGR